MDPVPFAVDRGGYVGRPPQIGELPAAGGSRARVPALPRQNGRVLIRTATIEDLPALQDIEWAAGASFREIGMPEVADDEPFSLAELSAYQRAGRAWVAVTVDPGAVPVGYLLAEPVDGCLHIEQVSVTPAHAGHGIGARLIGHLAELARADGVPALTLTTFVDVPWNAPYYRRLGFRSLSPDELTPGLVAIRAREARHGLDRWARVCMRREL
jgi:GNAT superfamily N-acetyltransferase